MQQRWFIRNASTDLLSRIAVGVPGNGHPYRDPTVDRSKIAALRSLKPLGHVPEITDHDAEMAGHALAKYAHSRVSSFMLIIILAMINPLAIYPTSTLSSFLKKHLASD